MGILSTYHDGVVMSTSKPEHNTSAREPMTAHKKLSFVPNPADKVSQSTVSCDVIVAGGYRHRDDITTLRK